MHRPAVVLRVPLSLDFDRKNGLPFLGTRTFQSDKCMDAEQVIKIITDRTPPELITKIDRLKITFRAELGRPTWLTAYRIDDDIVGSTLVREKIAREDSESRVISLVAKMIKTIEHAAL